jgi:hypothetical protein
MVVRVASKSTFDIRNKTKSSVAIIIAIVFLIQLMFPITNGEVGNDTDNLQICSELNAGFCDNVNDSDDESTQESWIEGVYSLTMVDTGMMQLSATWAIYEYDRAPMGFSGSAANTALQNDGIFAGDGIPADVIRNSWDEPWDGNPGSEPVKDKLMSEINGSISSILGSLGTASTPSTSWIGQVTDDQGVVDCETDRESDDDGNAYSPPICVQTNVDISISPSKFNLNSNPNLDLESAYKALLLMGGSVKTVFPISVESGHKSTYFVEPPDYATVISTGGLNNEKIFNSGDFPHNSGKWVSSNLNLATGYSGNLEFTLGFRNNASTNTFSLDENDMAMDFNVILDLSDEDAATIDLVAQINHIETSSVEGLSIIPAGKGSLPVVTSDGIRMAHHNGLINLDTISDNFPVSSVGDSLSSNIPGLSVQMGNFEWILDGSNDLRLGKGGLNYVHTMADCGESGGYYCMDGGIAMGNNHPVFLRSTSQPFEMRLGDLIGDKLGDLTFLSGINQDDLEKIVNSGMSFETILDPSFLSAMKPEGIGNSEINLELILPTWAQNTNGESSIILSHKLNGQHVGEFGLTGSSSFDWNHALCYSGPISCDDNSADVFCKSTEKSCQRSEVNLDITEYSFSELQKGITIEFSLDIDLAVHRIEVPTSLIDSMQSDDTALSLPVLPVDLLKLILDIADRGEAPYSTSFSICDDTSIEICKEDQLLEFSTNGLSAFTNEFGESVTSLIKSELSDNSIIRNINLDGFKINTTLSGLVDSDNIIDDSESINLAISIPKVRTTIGVGNSWGEIIEIINGGNTEDLQIDIDAPTLSNALVNPIMHTMMSAMNGLTETMAAVAAASMADGLVLEVPSTNVPSSKSVGMPIDLSLKLPLGIYIDSPVSTQSDITISTDSKGRQIINYRTSSDIDDSLTFNLVVGWQWILIQLLPYILIQFLFIAWRIRARMKKKQRKRRAAEIELIETEATENRYTPINTDSEIEVINVSNCNISIKKRVSD